MPKIAAVVILYNPDKEVYNNIMTYLDQTDKLFIVDNSEKVNYSLTEKIKLLKNTEYICNNSNIGIAAALNLGAGKALNEGYDFLLTMDQDSKASSGMVEKLLKIINTSDKIGIVAAEHVNPDIQEEPKTKIIKEIVYTMTSGNLVNLSAYKEVGGYLEKLFIDHVDHEFCLRLNRYGFKIIKAFCAVVYHKVGTASKKKFFNHYLYPTNHSPVRIYYRTRNRFFVDNLYKNIFPEYVKEDRWNMRREILEIILYDDERMKKIKMMFKGYSDFRHNRLGKYKSAY
jgi:rhamnosyltransferase